VAADQRFYTHAPGLSQDAVITLIADADEIHVLRVIHFSYRSAAAPSIGKLTVDVGGATVYEDNVVEAGPKQVLFDDGLYGNKNEALVITLLGLNNKVGRLNAIVD